MVNRKGSWKSARIALGAVVLIVAVLIMAVLHGSHRKHH